MFPHFFHRNRRHQQVDAQHPPRETVPMERIHQVRALVRDLELKAQQIRQTVTRPPETEQRVSDA